jgi:hypothetical protein
MRRRMKLHRPTGWRALFGLALVASLLAAGGCAEEIPVPPGTIVLDDDHDTSTDELAERYVIEARPTLKLDPRGYEVRGRNKAADSIHVIGRAEYHVAWDGVSPIEIGPENLKPLKSTDGAFPGFEPGVKYVIGAGAEYPDGRGLNLDVMWAGLVDVHAPTSR